MSSLSPEDRGNFWIMSRDNILHSFAGIVTGVIVNEFGQMIYDTLGITNRNVMIVGQIVICSLFISFLHTRVNARFAWEWQNITPGIFFTAFFFGVQYLFFSSFEEVYGIIPRGRIARHERITLLERYHSSVVDPSVRSSLQEERLHSPPPRDSYRSEKGKTYA